MSSPAVCCGCFRAQGKGQGTHAAQDCFSIFAMYTIFCAILPAFLVIAAGCLVEKRQIMPENTAYALSAFAINIAIPCLTFHIMSTAPLDKMTQWSWWAGILFVQTGLYIIFFFLLRLRGRDTGEAVISSLSVSFANVGFVGLPVIMNIYGDNNDALTVAGLVMVASNTLPVISQMTLMAWSRKKKKKPEQKKAPLPSRIWSFVKQYLLGNSVLMSTVLGIAVAASGIHVWDALDKGIAMIGYTAPVCMLFTMGFSMRENIATALSHHSISLSQQIWLGVLRLVILPLLTLVIMMNLDIDPLWVSVTTIACATGSAIFVSALAQIYQAVPGQAAMTIAVTNLLSLFSLSGMLMLLQHLGYLSL